MGVRGGLTFESLLEGPGLPHSITKYLRAISVTVHISPEQNPCDRTFRLFVSKYKT